mgnify:CR=1 FL=1
MHVFFPCNYFPILRAVRLTIILQIRLPSAVESLEQLVFMNGI